MSVVTRAAVDIEKPPPRARGWPRARVVGYALVGFWILFGIGIAVYLVYAWNGEFFARYAPAYLQGLGTTLALVAISMVLGALFSLPVTYARMSTNRYLSVLAYCYVYFFRGTPLLVQVYLVYYGLGSFRVQLESVGLWWFFRDAFNCGVFAFALNTAAYQAEILRGAIESVPRGQWEGAASLGLHKLQTLRKVVLPQAFIVALRPYGNELVLMIKASAIVAIITVYDLMGNAKLAYAKSFDFQAYVWVAIVYLVMVEILRHGVEWIERRITIHLIR
ncbi:MULTISPECIES: ABC transporter permease [unclassified Mesorhizobium]|uniref:ABC transporter permease n=1 Tax=unclassified Mesorhizobium TaxID=325217 RepID=UPI0003CE443F|nr:MULTISPECIES: ABC transporter permease [unclassified Mesorhizobium]ESX12205.1 amino acid ABC transporter permease [Mesorhizobium sp. LSJC265A00]ESX17996.1 amino acid ABC transporter permease [Mesorhizobium sp. LSJC264A00]ESX95818.1 amino acid ABC transporter permease [Mesorhizobium sp. LNJC405B00]ESY20330.1 amino acid ABC transporter permease [Mesorhizobium sp. LNJC391B00]ESZ44640.1 amino acid ABC transporter permease [Mesorhizobium sp. L103C565B0]